MVCEMALTSYLLTTTAFSAMKESDNTPAGQPTEQTGDNILTLFDYLVSRTLVLSRSKNFVKRLVRLI